MDEIEETPELVMEEAVVRYDELMMRLGDREKVLAQVLEEHPGISREELESATWLTD